MMSEDTRTWYDKFSAKQPGRPWPFGETTNNLTMRQKLEKSIAALRGSQNTPRPADRPALTPGEWTRPKAPATNDVPAVTNSVKGSALSAPRSPIGSAIDGQKKTLPSYPRIPGPLQGVRNVINGLRKLPQRDALKKAPNVLKAAPLGLDGSKRASLLTYAYLVGRQCGKNASLTMKQPTGLTRKIPSALPKVGLTQARPVTMPPARLTQKRPSAFNR